MQKQESRIELIPHWSSSSSKDRSICGDAEESMGQRQPYHRLNTSPLECWEEGLMALIGRVSFFVLWESRLMTSWD